MKYEVEMKFRASDRDDVATRLAQSGVAWSEPVTQIDRYLSHPARDFAQTDEALRLRATGERCCVTYKGPKLDPTTKTRREIELPLNSGPRTIDDFTELLEALGFRRVAEVLKSRRLGHLTYRGLTFDVSFDDVDEVGPFVELETVASDETLDAARAALLALAGELGLSTPERRSYLELLLESRGAASTRRSHT